VIEWVALGPVEGPAGHRPELLRRGGNAATRNILSMNKSNFRQAKPQRHVVPMPLPVTFPICHGSVAGDLTPRFVSNI